MLRKTGIGFAAVFAVVLTTALVAAVSNAHFVGTPTITESGNTVTASGKVAGLGDVETITVTVDGDAACINPGMKHPKAENKESFSDTDVIPVQNGKANFRITLTATFQPNCSPPMTVDWSNVTITVTAADGTFLQFP